MATASRDQSRLLAALEAAGPDGLTQTQIYSDVFDRNRPAGEIDSLLTELQTAGVVQRQWIGAAGGRHRKATIRYNINAYSDIFPANGNGKMSDGPPPGVGWLPLRETRFRAAHGVMPAFAARVGKRLWAQSVRGRRNPGGDPISPEYRGGRHLAEIAYRSYLASGVIEVQGDWVRLARNPPTRPRHHWYEAWLHILADAHPTLDGKWHRKLPRTLRSVKEAQLGRQLEVGDYILRRKPGAAGSWNPRDIDVYVRLPDDWPNETTT